MNIVTLNQRRLGVFCFASTLVLTACAPARQTNDVAQTPSWSVSLKVSGGFAGVDYFIASDHQGAWRYEKPTGNVAQSRSLTPAQVRELSQLVRALPSQVQIALNERCSDCFNYVLSVTKSGDASMVKVQVQLDSTTLSGHAAEALINMLLKTRTNSQEK